ncbi:OmpA family protein [Streptomyces sp. NPDC050560]|uniref:OmpA family protein n=1 Tax=Streptomyces sp. NPDC050560 TaxID=3365630 RepID=UPI0037A1A720
MASAPRTPRRAGARAAAGAALGVLVLGVLATPDATADDSPYPSASASAPVQVDPNDPDLKLPAGATLADPKVLDIKSVVEDIGGEERREDTNSDVKFALQSEVLFGKDSSDLSGDANSRISQIADEIKNQGANLIRVFGFTDNLGTEAHGDKLSKERAEAVHSQLAQDLQGADVTFEVRGYGEDYPIASNDSEDGRKKNRRVEISFPRSESDSGSDSGSDSSDTTSGSDTGSGS